MIEDILWTLLGVVLGAAAVVLSVVLYFRRKWYRP